MKSVVIRMEPTLNPNCAFNVRSFFTDGGARNIGGGLVLWRGYFQSIRPAVGRMLINVNISTGVMCEVHPGRTVRNVPPERTRDVLEFSTERPAEMLNSIRNGRGVPFPTIFVHLRRHLNCSTDPELE